jgi:hypothetical protein
VVALGVVVALLTQSALMRMEMTLPRCLLLILGDPAVKLLRHSATSPSLSLQGPRRLLDDSVGSLTLMAPKKRLENARLGEKKADGNRKINCLLPLQHHHL